MRRTIFILFITALFVIGLCGSLMAASRGIGDLAGSAVAVEAGEEAETGLFRGEIGIYYEGVDYEKGSFQEDGEDTKLDDSDVWVPYVQAAYVTPQYSGFRASAGFTGFKHLYNDSENHRNSSDYDHVVFHRLYLQYALSETTVTVGRQVLEDSIFLTEYYEAAALRSNEVENVSLLLAAVRKFADSDVSNYIEFEDVNEEDEDAGDMLYAAELSWIAVPEEAEGTLYYYKQKDLFDLYGAHIELSQETEDFGYGIEADYYATKEDDENGLRDADGKAGDGSVYHISPVVEVGDFSIAVGYIQADRDVGAREGGPLDDYFNPLNEGDRIYEPDAKTWYGELSYESDGLEAKLAYGSTRYLDDSRHLREEEYDFEAEWAFREDWKLEAAFSVVKSDAPEGDFSVLEAVLKYEF